MEKRQIPFSPPDITDLEIAEVIRTLKSGWITTGPRTKLFERKIAAYCNVKKAVALNSATACLEAIFYFLGVGEGDEVITSAYTYTASASPVCHVGARLVLVDVAKDSFEIDYDALENAITEKTKAIIPVDLGGIMCDYTRLLDIVERKKTLYQPNNEIQKAIGRVAIVADSAHAFGAERKVKGNWKKCGSIADFTSFSFHAVKNLTTAEGGALTWNSIEGVDDDWIYHQFMLYSLHGQTKDALAKNQLGAWEYDIVSPAYKCNMTDIMSAIGLKQLERYLSLLKRRQEIIKRYDDACDKLGVLHMNHYGTNHFSSGHLYMIRLPEFNESERNDVIVKMAERGIACNVHYKPLPMMSAYKAMGWDIKDFPNAYAYYKNEVTLPLHTKLTDEDVEYIILNLKKVI
jgi:dTDP-4-amino-4,6-dideoxygalactose transaminase